MSGLAILILVFAAFIHAVWNLLAKRSIDSVLFGFLSCLVSALIYIPLATFVVTTQPVDWNATTVGALAISALLQLVGFNCILLSYKIGDYSVMYPVQRGTGPLVATLAAIIFLAERPSIGALAGIALILIGVFIIGGGGAILKSKSLKPIAFGCLTGVAIAAVTVWSKYCLSVLNIPFVLIDYAGVLGVALVLTPYALKNHDKLKREWQDNQSAIIGVGVLRSLAYMSILFVLTTVPVYYVAPLREMSILFAALIGAKLLKEGQVKRRFSAVLVMFVGLICLSLN
ncbi:MAG: EamA family transporter [Candidatus Obscuribacterales bacterium]|nr:EamA family transporter [Candidatus Obscuribacterales bacterium]